MCGHTITASSLFDKGHNFDHSICFPCVWIYSTIRISLKGKNLLSGSNFIPLRVPHVRVVTNCQINVP